MDDLKKLIKEDKITVGTAAALRQLKSGKAKKIWLSSNAPKDVREDISHYASISKTEVIELSIPNDELGVICKKQFPISVVSA